jgi:hypothetical protein
LCAPSENQGQDHSNAGAFGVAFQLSDRILTRSSQVFEIIAENRTVACAFLRL